MAKGNGGGLIERLYFGKEKTEDYARSTLPSNRWELFFDILKGRFGKLIIINLLIWLFFIPLIALLIVHTIMVSGFGGLCPYNQPFGTGYMAAPDFSGYAESIITNVNITVLSILPLTAVIASIGISGGLYVIRNMIWTEGIFVASDFWKGVKQNFLNVMIISVIYSIIFVISVICMSYMNQILAIGYDKAWLLITSKVIIILVLVFVSIIALHMLTMTVNYELKFRQLLKNSFLFTVGLIPQNIIFILLAFFPFLLLIIGGNFLIMLASMLVLFLGFAYAFLVWTDYCQWGYDQFINVKAGNKRNRGIYDKVNSKDPESIKKYKEQLRIASKTSLGNSPVKPITDEELKVEELPQAFNRGDLAKLRDSKQAIIDDHNKYVAEHASEYGVVDVEIMEEIKREDVDKAKEIERVRRELAKRNKKKR